MTALESALAVVDQAPLVGDQASLWRAKARGLMRGYDARWQNQKHRTLAVEELVTADLFNPATERRSRTFTTAGKIDVRVLLDDQRGIVDHKTASDDISDPAGPYWRQLAIEGQLSHYFLMEWLNGRKPDFAMWDVIRKPSISPRQIQKKEMESLVITKRWFGYPVPDEEILLAQQTQRESNLLYEFRLAQDSTEERPGWYFQRRSIPRTDAEIIEYASELWDHTQDILISRRENRHPRNSGACMNYGRPCRFLGVCSGHDDIDSGNWKRVEWQHPELPQFDNSGLSILTNSRIRTYQTCRRQHFYQYEERVQRTQPEDAESLIFGDLMHQALAAWWLHFKTKENNDGIDNVPANSVGSATESPLGNCFEQGERTTEPVHSARG